MLELVLAVVGLAINLPIVSEAGPTRWESLRLPEEHIPYYFHNNPATKAACSQDSSCPFKHLLSINKCWGYEQNCSVEDRMVVPQCQEEPSRGRRPKTKKYETFWEQGDFGFAKVRMDNFKTLCKPAHADDSLLSCSDDMRYCQAKNIYLDFSRLNSKKSTDRYRGDVFLEGQLGGHCHLDEEELRRPTEHGAVLQSWHTELQNYTALDFKPIDYNHCDVIIDKPTVLMKLDSGVNMYHHYCDFLNLYLSQHMNNSFNMDINIIMWDTSGYGYGDLFSSTWKAFTHHPIIHLRDYDQKKVCIKDAVFPLLARQRLGIFYSTHLTPGCSGTSLFRAFSQHLIHRLNLTQHGPLETKIRVTLLDRKTKFRNIMNQDEIVNALKNVGEYEVQVAEYNHNKMPLLEQYQSTYDSDIFLGMHGAGLTHLLLLPDWGTVFELYNCEDIKCYKDLARLRGVHYLTWEKQADLIQEDEGHHPGLGAHAKFTNYGFGVTEMLRMVAKAAENVRNHPAYKLAMKQKWEQHGKKVEL